MRLTDPAMSFSFEWFMGHFRETLRSFRSIDQSLGAITSSSVAHRLAAKVAAKLWGAVARSEGFGEEQLEAKKRAEYESEWIRAKHFCEMLTQALYKDACPALWGEQREQLGLILAVEQQLFGEDMRREPAKREALCRQLELLLQPAFPKPEEANGDMVADEFERGKDSQGSERRGQGGGKRGEERVMRPRWLPAGVWGALSHLERSLPRLEGLCQSLLLSPSQWEQWAGEEVVGDLPPPWSREFARDSLYYLLIVRCVRPDALPAALRAYIQTRICCLMQRALPTVLADAITSHPPTTPLLVRMSEEVSPVLPLRLSAMQRGVKLLEVLPDECTRVERLQAAVTEAGDMGWWVFLHEVQRAPCLLPELTSIATSVSSGRVHTDFRLWISTESSLTLPPLLLDASLRIALEPPVGLMQHLAPLLQASESQNSQDKAEEREAEGEGKEGEEVEEEQGREEGELEQAAGEPLREDPRPAILHAWILAHQELSSSIGRFTEAELIASQTLVRGHHSYDKKLLRTSDNYGPDSTLSTRAVATDLYSITLAAVSYFCRPV
ncbi:MAG: hypothetical protein SGPRY_009359 [Prymnesium sp.]